MKIIAHRGFWTSESEKNTKSAFTRAFDAGYGVETDVRDQNGKLVISHDMPVGNNFMTFDEFLETYKSFPNAGTIALNIKSDGLQKSILETLNKFQVSDIFVFDMAVPDSLSYLKSGMTTFTRHSEIEPTPPFYDLSSGVWIDSFYGEWFTDEDIKKHIVNGKMVSLVSPELHKRGHENAWQSWVKINHDKMFLCTDFPKDADLFFSEKIR